MRGYPCCECCRTDTIHPDHHVVPCPTCNNPTVDRLRAEVERLTQQIETAKRIGREQVLASHTCQPVWRPTTSAEIQPGWEVRSRSETGMPSSWGIAHHRDEDGDWRTGPEDAVLTYDADGWTCETTAPVPEPNPARIQVVLDWASEAAGRDRHADAVDLLTRLDNLKEYKP